MSRLNGNIEREMLFSWCSKSAAKPAALFSKFLPQGLGHRRRDAEKIQRVQNPFEVVVVMEIMPRAREFISLP